MAIIVLLVGHYRATIVLQLWHSLLHIYGSLWGHGIVIVLQLNDRYGATTKPLIKYYQFTIHIKLEFVYLKLDPNAT